MKMLKLLLVVFIVAGFATIADAVDTARTAKLVELEGSAEVKTLAGDRVPAQTGMLLYEGDAIKTKSNAWALLSLEGIEKATVEMEENSLLLISQLMEDPEKGTQQTLLDLALGKILVKVEKLKAKGSRFEVKTPTSVVGVRGTTFEVEVEGLD